MGDLQHESVTGFAIQTALEEQPVPINTLQAPKPGAALFAPAPMDQLTVINACEPTGAEPARETQLQVSPELPLL